MQFKTNKDTMKDISLKDICKIFFKIGTLSFGGVYSMLCFIERELVEKRMWLSNEDFMESVAIGQMTPGAPIVNTGICIGYKLKKIKGALVVTFFQSITGVTLSIILAYFYINAQDNYFLKSTMKGVSCAVVGLLAAIIYKMACKTINSSKLAIFAMAAFIALYIFKINAIYVIIAAGAIGLLVFNKRKQV
jgi:chromate transporter